MIIGDVPSSVLRAPGVAFGGRDLSPYSVSLGGIPVCKSLSLTLSQRRQSPAPGAAGADAEPITAASCSPGVMGANRSAASSTFDSRLISPELGAVCIGWESTHHSDRSMSACSRCGSYQVWQSLGPATPAAARDHLDRLNADVSGRALC